MLRAASTLLLLLLLVVPSTFAGKNAGGALIVHTDSQVIWDSFCWGAWCEDHCYYDPVTCENAWPESDIDGTMFATIVWCIAAFHELSDPGYTGLHFGIDHNFPLGWIADWNACGPAGTTEIADLGWPVETGTGTSITFGSPVVGDRLARFYWFGAYGLEGNYLATTIHPTYGAAAFLSDDDPAEVDGIDRFGMVRWFEPGYNECPIPPAGVQDPNEIDIRWGEIKSDYR
jgi:hypothetical protein